MPSTDPASDYLLTIRYGEVGPNGRAGLSALASWLQEAAGHNALSLGFGEENMAGRSLAWILTRLVLRIHRLPSAGESIRVRTWPSGIDRLAHRGYQVYDEAGTLIASSGSAWSLMDTSTRRMAAVPPELNKAFPKESLPCDAFTCRTLPRLPAPRPEAEGKSRLEAVIRVRQEDLDIHRHVNNAHYFSWLLECLPCSPSPPAPDAPLFPRLIDLTFRAECFYGEELLSICAPLELSDESGMFFSQEAPFRLIHAIRRLTADQEDVCRGVTCWTRSPCP